MLHVAHLFVSCIKKLELLIIPHAQASSGYVNNLVVWMYIIYT